MPYAMLYAVERSTFSANQPDAATIHAAFAGSVGRSPQETLRTIGPTARITRLLHTWMGLPSETETHAAWLVEYADTPAGRDALRDVPVELTARLRAYSRDWTEVVVQPYAEKLHGPVSWWASGQAARTVTRDAPKDALTRLAPGFQENPVGPDVRQLGELASLAVIATVILGVAGAAAYVSSGFTRRAELKRRSRD